MVLIPTSTNSTHAMSSTSVSSFDGQNIWDTFGNKLYEIGNYLGGGVAGVVYECERTTNLQHFALKILNPVGYKLERKAALKQCKVLVKGDTIAQMEDGSYETLTAKHVWWLIHSPTGAVIAAYHDVERGDLLKEMTLPRCVDVWGLDVSDSPSERQVVCDGRNIAVPTLPPKYAEFLVNRGKIYREILNMAHMPMHVNVLRLHEVMELIQDSKCTIFLVLELAKGGELFDRIAIDQGASEEVAKNYVTQLLEGLQHCHDQGVCHRDLKPENLLLADDDGCLLKIADFGLSATFRFNNSEEMQSSESLPLRRTLQSVVGSPFYVAPEVLAYQGYDGTKADMWSVGVILYAMLAGNLPFGKELATCVRFAKFKQWMDMESGNAPSWLFPAKASEDAKGLLVALLNPNPNSRISVHEAMEHKWIGKKRSEEVSATPCNKSPPSPTSSISPVSPSGLSQMLASDTMSDVIKDAMMSDSVYGCGGPTGCATPSPTRRAQDIFSSPPLSHESIDGSPRLESLAWDPTEVLGRQIGAIDLQKNRKRRKSFPPANAMTDDPWTESEMSSSLPSCVPSPTPSPTRSPADSYFNDCDQIVGTPNGSMWGLEPPSSSHNGSFMMEMFPPNTKGAEEPPTFVDHIRRSTRFVTSLPPAEVLGGIEDIVNSGSIPLLPPFEHQETRMSWEDFRLEVRWDSCLVYSVHVFLIADTEPDERSDYLVEFRRGHMEIFDFKRYYESVLERLSRYVKDDPRVLDFNATGILPGLQQEQQEQQYQFQHEQGVFPFSE